MANIIIENVVQIFATLAVTLIGVFGAWLTTRIAKREELKTIAAATEEVIQAAEITVLELQQTTVEGWKKANEDGKLTKDEIAELGKLLVAGAMEKMSDTTKNLLNSVGVDISALIRSAGESLITRMKMNL